MTKQPPALYLFRDGTKYEGMDGGGGGVAGKIDKEYFWGGFFLCFIKDKGKKKKKLNLRKKKIV